VEEIFEARPPKGRAVVSDINGRVVEITEVNREKTIKIEPELEVKVPTRMKKLKTLMRKASGGDSESAKEFRVASGTGLFVEVGSEVKKGDIVLLRTDHTKNIHEEDYFSTNPVISFKLAEKLVEKKVKMVGIDSFSPDNSPFQIHKLLLSNDILILENLMNLDKIAKPRFKLYAFPLKLENDGAPCRAVAEV
jgi:hypothetical protein